VAILLCGIVIGRALPGTGSAIAADPTGEASLAATSTRAAELEELARLRTQVAQPPECSPVPTETPASSPTPEPTATTAPAQPAGTAVLDANGLAITVLSIQPVAAPEGIEPRGLLMRLNFVISNDGNEPILPNFTDWRLVDASGNRYAVHVNATDAIVGRFCCVAVPAHSEEERALIFDVGADSGTTFVLENERNPLFRIEVTIEERG
jgi:hypothetical protein